LLKAWMACSVVSEAGVAAKVTEERRKIIATVEINRLVGNARLYPRCFI